MSESRLFTVRPLSKQPRNDLRDSFRIYLSPASLTVLKLRPGDLCSMRLTEGSPKTVIAWTAFENIQNSVVQTSKPLQDCYGIRLGDKVVIDRADKSLNEVDAIRLEECTDSDRLSAHGLLDPADKEHWEWGLQYPLLKCEVISTGLVFDIELKGHRRSFKVAEIRSQDGSCTKTIFRFTNNSTVEIGLSQGSVPGIAKLRVQPSGLEGISDQVAEINECLADFIGNQEMAMPSFYERVRGMLIYGPKGTGKTALLQKIKEAGWRRSLVLGSSVACQNVRDGEAQLRKVFHEATLLQPSVIIIDQVDFIAPKRTSLEASSPLTYVLCEIFDDLKNTQVLVVAASRHPNDVDDALRTPHRLAVEIELPVPTADARSHILRSIRGSSSEPGDKVIDFIAEKTHGCVGADLFTLLQLSCRKARVRQTGGGNLGGGSSTTAIATGIPNQGDVLPPLEVRECDVLLAMKEIRPTAMREVLLETPKVKWSDIGGQHDIKKRLQKAIERPLKSPDRSRRLNVNTKKGILLYGPPGCSKTLTVKALASESGLNFLAVKGAEILSMYVGESERTLREIFRKARAASPSIIFFDEIDAIASKRGIDSQGGVHVLTTLLNEMDGIEELRNVLIVAATNKPELLDPALMRPGRLDNILYVGPPNFEARREIITVWSSRSVVHPEVDLDELAAKTEGYSGAEIVSICETAGEAALDEEEETGQEGRIMPPHFKYALGQVKKQITKDDIWRYEQWGTKSSEL